MLKSKIYIDKIGLSYHGGIEKNFLKIQQELQKKYSDIKTVEDWGDFLSVLRLFIFNRGDRINYFTFKGSAFRCILLTLLLPKVKIFIRVNNSPEAYLFWKDLKSLISFSLRIILLKRRNIYFIFNSKTVMDFYIPSMITNNYCYLPNFYPETRILGFEVGEQSKIFAASRLSPEKRYNLTLKILNSIQAKCQAKVNYYSSSKIQQKLEEKHLIKSYDKLKINYNDIYLSLSAFEGMPNMAIEALLSGAKLVLSNCWAHAELKQFTKEYDLSARVILLETIEQSYVEEIIMSMLEMPKKDEINSVRQKLTKMHEDIQIEFGYALNKICNFIDD